MEITEYARLNKIEEKHWWYRAMHELVDNLCQSLTFVKHKSDSNILDAGCGTGGLTKKLQKFGKVTGLDISPVALTSAKEKKLLLVEGSVNNLPFRQQSFDLIISVSVLYHQKVNDVTAINEFYKVLKAKGKLLLILPAFSWAEGNHDKLVATKKRYTLPEMKSMLKNSGFEIVEGRYIFSFLFPLFILKRFIEKIFPSVNKISDLSVPPKLVNYLLIWICRFEWNLGKLLKFPVGSSLLIIGEKA